MTLKKDTITPSKIKDYYDILIKALKIAKKSVAKSKQKPAKEIFLMVESYISDSQYFKEKGDYINSYGCLNYAYGWLDCGARLKIFLVKDTNLFTI